MRYSFELSLFSDVISAQRGKKKRMHKKNKTTHTPLFAAVNFGRPQPPPTPHTAKSGICHLLRAEIRASLKDRKSKHRRTKSES